MISTPVSPQELATCQAFMFAHAGVAPSTDARYLVWLQDGAPAAMVCFNGFVGRVCQMHVALAPGYHFSPREMLAACFGFAFNACEREMVLGVVNSRNEAAMRYDRRLGFRELYRLPGMHEEGGALVLLGMTKEECPWLERKAQAAPVTH